MELKDMLGGDTVPGKDVEIEERPALVPRQPYEPPKKQWPVMEIIILTVCILNTMILFAIYQIIKTL